MAIFTVLGAGMMGSALALPLVDRGHEVRLVGTHLDDAIIAGLRADGVHPTLRYPIPGVVPYSHHELGAAMAGSDVVALGVSSAGIDWACAQLKPHARPDLPLFMITKGLRWDGSALHVLPDVVARATGVRAPAAVAGPCIAGELARRVPSCVMLAGRDRGVLDAIADLLRTDYYHVWSTTDVVGTEVCAALKNAYAMGVAFGTGMHERAGGQPGPIGMHNYESAVFAQAIVEMQRIVVAMGGDASSAAGLAGAGDLDVTNNGGRTGRFGRLLGSGLSVAEAVEAMQGATLECLEIIAVLRQATSALEARGALGKGALPLLDHMAEVVLDGAPIEMPFARFFGAAG